MTERSKTIRAARNLLLTSIPGTVQVDTWNEPGISFELTGPEDALKDISHSTDAGVLHIRGPRNGGGIMIRGGGGQVVIGDMVSGINVFGRGGGTYISGSDISTGGGRRRVVVDGQVVSPSSASGEAAEPVRLTVHVPARASIGITDHSDGIYRLGNIGGTLNARLKGAGSVTAGTLAALNVDISGAADLEAAWVAEQLRADISGTGSVTVRKGMVEDLRASVSGTGSIRFGGTAADADLDVSGIGSIRVDTVTRTLRSHQSGIGTIDVRVQPARAADDFWA